jgi:glycosyltransferase involved in cell wall biosynthesis
MSHASPKMLDEVVIAIPCFNAQATLRKTLQNTLEQSFREFRVIVYDDGSTDHSPDIVKSIADSDSRIELVRNEINRGRPQARNALLGLASDAIIAWQDADDLWHPTKLARQVEFYAHKCQDCDSNRIALVSSLERCRPQDSIGESAYLAAVLGKDYYRVLHPPRVYDVGYVCSANYMSFPFYLQSTFARAALYIQAGGFDDQMPWYEDLDMGLRLLGTGTQIFGLKSDVALAYYFSGAPRLAPAVITDCLLRIYRNNEALMVEGGIDPRHDLSLRKLTLLFLGMIRKREFGAALDILAQERPYVFAGSGLEELYLSNLQVLNTALRAACLPDRQLERGHAADLVPA